MLVDVYCQHGLFTALYHTLLQYYTLHVLGVYKIVFFLLHIISNVITVYSPVLAPHHPGSDLPLRNLSPIRRPVRVHRGTLPHRHQKHRHGDRQYRR